MTSSNSMQDTLALIGRALIAYFFIPSGFGKIMGFAGVVGYVSSKGVPLPEVCAALAIAAELGLGILLLIGWQARWAALALALFTLVASFIFHAYWSLPADQQMMQQLMFMKNLAVAGGLLMLAVAGPGMWSVDRGR
jgi:putative oxidoreductase